MRESLNCITCGLPTSGHFCSNCGETAVSKHDYSLSHFLELFVESVFHLDGRLVNTFRLLLDQPGALAHHFIQGRRKPYMGPVQCFLVANLFYFLIQPLTGFETFTTTLNLHLKERPWSGLAGRMVAAKLAVTGMSLEAYAEKFDHAVHLQAHTLLFIMIPIFALLAMVFYGRTRRYYAEHLVFSFYVFALLLIWIGISALFAHLVVVILILSSVRINGDWYELLSTAFTFVPFAVYLFFASRRFYRHRGIRTAIETVCLTILMLEVITLYRFVLFFTAFYVT